MNSFGGEDKDSIFYYILIGLGLGLILDIQSARSNEAGGWDDGGGN